MATFDSLRTQTEIYGTLFIEDVPKRVLVTLCMFGPCYMTDMTVLTTVLLAGVMSAELALNILTRRVKRGATLSARHCYATLILHSMQAVLGLSASLILMVQPILALILLGYTWAVLSISISVVVFSRIPLFFWAMSLPSAAILILAVVIGINPEPIPPTRLQVLIKDSSVFFLLFIMFAFHKSIRLTNAELDKTRIQAVSRLQKLEYISRHDDLTGLKNRAAFEKRLAALSGGGELESTNMMMVDLDGFKPINDSYGHSAGDAVLKALAKRFAKLVPHGADVYRIGGDEFVILLPDSGLSNARALGQTLIAAACEPVPFDDLLLTLSASIGLALGENAGGKASVLCANADQAMYRAKERQGGAVVVYDPKSFAKRLTFEHRQSFVAAIEREEIRPHYQPKFDLQNKCLAGFEALVRWEHPEHGLLFPHAFLNDFAELGLLADMTPAILRRTLQDIDIWLAEGLSPGRVAINMPEVVLATSSRRDELDWVLAEFPEASRHLIFEITEDVFIARSAGIIQSSISHFRDLGIQIALDDFGTGYASFQHLQKFNFDELKIDTSFVAGLGRDAVAEVIVKGFVSIARGLDVKIVAEGIEREEQRAQLVDLGVHYGQGYLFGAAVPRDEARRFMTKTNGEQEAG